MPTYDYRCGYSIPASDPAKEIIDAALDKLEAMGVTISQVKRKFGGLRLYIESEDPVAQQIVRETEYAAGVTR